MKKLYFAALAASLTTSAIAAEKPAPQPLPAAQEQRSDAPLSASFQNGLDQCAITRTADGFSVSGTGALTFTGDSGVDLGVTLDDNGQPSIAAHAINTKGTGATNHRISTKTCTAVQPGRIAMSSRSTAPSAATCSLSGDADAPSVTFAIPLAAFAGAKYYVGHVTLIKREPGAPAVSKYFAKRGYDYAKASSAKVDFTAPEGEDVAMTVIAACDTSGLVAKGSKPVSGYDLAVGKKA